MNTSSLAGQPGKLRPAKTRKSPMDKPSMMARVRAIALERGLITQINGKRARFWEDLGFVLGLSNVCRHVA